MLTVHANAKINWSLSILGTRSDGYHVMDMLMQSISLFDELTFEEAPALSLNGSWDDKNLVCRAALLLQKETGCTQGAAITLQKNIPSMAGLGGGSADGAAALLALNKLWQLGLPLEKLLSLGLSLGADFPFCLTGGLQRVGGIGEKLTPLTAPSSPSLILIMPDGGLSTGSVFRAFDALPAPSPMDTDAAIGALTRGDYARFDKLAQNDLTPSAVALSPAVGEAIAALKAEGALFARMSGSGSCVFGVFEAEEVSRAYSALKDRYPSVFRAETRPCGVEFIDE